MLFAYLENALKDFRLFFFVWLLLNLYRIIFMWIMQDYIDGAGAGDILTSIKNGAALSLKTAGFITLFSFAFVTLFKTIAAYFKKDLPKIFDGLREKIGAVAIFIFTLLFFARFPYYSAFNVTYDWQIFMGLNDDVGSIINMMFTEYGFFWRIPLVCVIVYGLYKCFIKFLNFNFFDLKILGKIGELSLKKEFLYLVMVWGLTVGLGIFIRFGGAFSYSAGINWENAQVLSDKFLNECMLDDGQAMYRAYSMEMRMREDEILGIYPASINEFVSGENIETAEDLEKYLMKEALGARIEKPDHIFIIVGETFASWPLFKEYEDLNLGNYIKELSKEENAFYYESIMPSGEYTSVALNGLITGLLDTNIRINYQPRSFKSPYVTALAPQMEKLGFNTVFWYGGTLEWDHIGELAKAQGFNEAYGYPDFNGKKQNTWGTTDKELFDAVYKHLKNSPSSLHLIMTTSNHPPYNMDLKAEGIDSDEIEENLKKYPKVLNPEELAIELSYYSYMDKEIYNFIKKVYKQYPKSLFIVTGDHSVRMKLTAKPSDKEFVTVPLLFYGCGINQNILESGALPMHASIMPTLTELVAEKGFKYYSITPSLFEKNDFALMDKYYMDKFDVRKLYKTTSKGKAAYESFKVKTISWWLMFK